MRRALVVSFLVLAACSSKDDADHAPVVDALDMPDTAVPSTTARGYDVKGTISFHDDDGVVTAIRVLVPPAAPLDYALANGKASVSGAGFTMTLENAKPGATIDYEIAVVDDHGMESAHVKKTVHIP